MPLPPTPFDNLPNPLDAKIELAEVLQHPAAGDVGKWIDEAMGGSPSPGTIGRMELLRHWERLPSDKRRMLLLLAREMSQAEQSSDSASTD